MRRVFDTPVTAKFFGKPLKSSVQHQTSQAKRSF